MQWLQRAKTFLNEVVVETKKVTWPSKSEVVNTTIVVVIASVIFGVYLYFCDLVFLVVRDRVLELFGVFS